MMHFASFSSFGWERSIGVFSTARDSSSWVTLARRAMDLQSVPRAKEKVMADMHYYFITF